MVDRVFQNEACKESTKIIFFHLLLS